MLQVDASRQSVRPPDANSPCPSVPASSGLRTRSWYPWYVVSLLSLAYFFSFVDRVVISLLIVPIQQDLHIGDVGISLIVGMGFALFYTIFGLPIGRLVDRKNRRSIVIAGISIWSLATASCGAVFSFWQLFLARIMVAVGEATLSPSAYSLISDYFPPRRLSLAMSVYGVGVYVGAGAALILAGLVISAVGAIGHLDLPVIGLMKPWQAVFVAVGLPGLLIAALFFTVAEPARRGLVKGRTQSAHVSLAEVWQFLKLNRSTYSTLIGAFTLASLFGYGLNAWAPTLLIRNYGWDIGFVGKVYGCVVLVSGLSGVLLGGITADWLESRGQRDSKIRVMLLGYAFMLPCAIIGPLMPSATGAVIFLGCANFGFSFPAGSGIAALQTITPNQMRGQISALFLLVLNVIGLGLGPTLIAAITDYGFGNKLRLGYSISIVAAVVLPVALLLLAAGLRFYRQSVERSQTWAG